MLLKNSGETNVQIAYKANNNVATFKLENKRNVDRKIINVLKKSQISSIIS